jgi:multisubunit Na+/H+ antiporter MnhB subunit
LVSDRLLTSAIWLAGLSALSAILFYLLGAREIAVVELSVGVGLVTVLFVFAINIAGDEPTLSRPVFVRTLAWLCALAAAALLGWVAFPGPAAHSPLLEPTFHTVLWDQRGMDVLLQIVLIFSGALGVLGLLGSTHSSPSHPPAKEKTL